MVQDALHTYLETKLKLPLPGIIAHQKMAPQQRLLQSFKPEDFPLAKHASVLILIFKKNQKYYTILIKRANYPGVHGGQMSFPGGQKDRHDLNEKETAIRETVEEIGIEKKHFIHIGKLSDLYIPPSNFFVFPYVAFLKDPFTINRNIEEVEEIVYVELDFLQKPEYKSTIPIQRPDISFDAPCYTIKNYQIWGATALILSELEMLLTDFY